MTNTKPSTFNILSKFYVKVLSLDVYIRGTVSTRRYTRISLAARENDSLRTLLGMTWVCYNPTLSMMDDDGLDYPSITLSGEGCTQTDVWPSRTG
jgi:hypothetical protein